VGDSPISVEELSSLYSTLNADQRDELLQCLLIAASKGPAAMMGVIRSEMLVIAAEEMESRLQIDPP
jgi:hypothetical protein